MVLLSPVALIVTTYPVFAIADDVFGDAAGGRLAWFVGMAFYWVVWGWLFPWMTLGRQRIRDLIRPRRPTRTLAAYVGFIVVMAAAVRFLIPGMAYEKEGLGAIVLLGISPFANGLFEELLWRGVYLDVFRDNSWVRVVWASLWFGLWHLVPGSISNGGAHIAMVIGPIFMGLYLAFLAKKTDSVWWPAVAHALGGLVMIS